MATRCRIELDRRVVRIDPGRRILAFADGSARPYEALLSTLPLNRVMEMTGLLPAAPPDPFTSVLVVNIGAIRGPACPDDHWLYLPQSDCGCHRVGFYSNVDPSFLPAAARPAKERVSLYVERSFPGGQRPAAAAIDAHGRRVVEELRDWGFIERAEVVHPTWIDVAYTWSWPGSSWRAEALQVLQDAGIWQIGRYGRWRSRASPSRSPRASSPARASAWPTTDEGACQARGLRDRPRRSGIGRPRRVAIAARDEATMSDAAEPAGLSDEAVWHPCPADPACPGCNASMQGAAAALDWSFLDAVYCISLKIRDDRAAQAAAEFHKAGLCRRVLFYRPDKHPKNGFIGGWGSHRAVALHALTRGAERTLIFEDDVRFPRPVRPQTLRSIAHALDRLPPDWMIFFLGHWPLRAYPVRRNVLRTSSACSHAYIASARLLQWLADHPWDAVGIERSPIAGKGVDSAYARLPGTFALFPMIALQRVGRSDNFVPKQKARRRLRHLVTRTGYRELLLSKLMRPAEIIAMLLSPVFLLAALARRGRARLAARNPGRWPA